VGDSVDVSIEGGNLHALDGLQVPVIIQLFCMPYELANHFTDFFQLSHYAYYTLSRQTIIISSLVHLIGQAVARPLILIRIN
jgi:hypothetical protein